MFNGACSQDRVDIPVVGDFDNTVPSLIVEDATSFIQIAVDDIVQVWSGKPDVDPAVKQARAFVTAGGIYSFTVQPGDVVHVWKVA